MFTLPDYITLAHVTTRDVIAETNPHYFMDGSSLIIYSADLADSATYICRAVNDVGEDTKEIVVFVQSN